MEWSDNWLPDNTDPHVILWAKKNDLRYVYTCSEDGGKTWYLCHGYIWEVFICRTWTTTITRTVEDAKKNSFIQEISDVFSFFAFVRRCHNKRSVLSSLNFEENVQIIV